MKIVKYDKKKLLSILQKELISTRMANKIIEEINKLIADGKVSEHLISEVLIGNNNHVHIRLEGGTTLEVCKPKR